MMKRIVCFLLTLCLLAGTVPAVLAAEAPTQVQAYHAMIALEEEYPEGTPWTNDDLYNWKGYSSQNEVYWTGGYGCVGFAFMLSDAAFGNLPARYLDEVTIDHVRVGDILRVNNDSHSVIILEVHDDHVILAEGNYMGTVHWGRRMSADEIANADYAMTRYPKDYKPTLTGWRKAYYDLVQEGIAQDEISNWYDAHYSLIDINSDEYPELWVDHMIYASGCTLAAITEHGLYSRLMQSGGLRYLEGENIFVHSGGIQGYFFNDVYTIENGIFVSENGGTVDVNAGKFTWNGEAVPEWKYDAAIDALVNPSKSMYAHDSVYSYEEFLALLYELESQYGPEPDIPEKVFSDVNLDAYYYDAVLWAVDNQITNGRSATTFVPDDNCKRSEIVTFLWRAEDRPESALDEIPFSDVVPGEFYTDAIVWALDNEITNGMGDGTFGVNLGCTRTQVVTFLWRTAGCPKPNVAECEFSDVVPGEFYYDAVLWAVEKGITNGMGDGTFGVSRTCTRGQIVTFLHRFAG